MVEVTVAAAVDVTVVLESDIDIAGEPIGGVLLGVT